MTHSTERLKPDTPAAYCIRVQGFLDESYADRLGGLTIKPPSQEDEQPVTTLCGRLVDQAAFAGVLSYLYDLHLPLLSVEWVAVG